MHQLTAGRHLRRRLHDVQVREVPDVVQDIFAREPVQELPAPLLAVVVVLLLQPLLLQPVRLRDVDRDGAASISDAAEGRRPKGASPQRPLRVVESRAAVGFVASGVVDDDLGGGAAAFKLSLLPGLDVGRGA